MQGVAFLSPEPADLLEEFRRTGCWLRVGDTLRPGPSKFLAIARFAGQCSSEFNPELVVAWPLGLSHWIFLGVRSRLSPAALISHGGNPPGAGWFSHYVMAWACFWTTGLCRGRVIACSKYVQRLFQEIPLVPKSVVGISYNSVRAASIAERSGKARLARAQGAPFRAVMVATLEAHKDHATLVRAAALLRARGTALEIMIVGSGSLAESLKALSRSVGAESMVTFLGTRNDIPELLGQSDVFVLSTTPQEGRPGVILEALAAGLPIIASDVEPVREVLEDGKWGTLVPAGNPGALAAALASAVESRDGDQIQIKNRQAHAAQFTPNQMIFNYLAEAGIHPGIV